MKRLNTKSNAKSTTISNNQEETTMKKAKVKKPFYKRVWVWVLGGIVVINIFSGGEDTTETASTEPAKTEQTQKDPKQEAAPKTEVEEAAPSYGIGKEATVADVGFTVTNVQETKVIESGNQFIDNATTDGKFVLVNVSIKNGQKDALTILDSYFKIKVNGAEYDASTSSEVSMAMSVKNEDSFFLEQINPGLSKSGTVVFELPADADVSKAVLQCQTGAWGTEMIDINLK